MNFIECHFCNKLRIHDFSYFFLKSHSNLVSNVRLSLYFGTELIYSIFKEQILYISKKFVIAFMKDRRAEMIPGGHVLNTQKPAGGTALEAATSGGRARSRSLWAGSGSCGYLSPGLPSLSASCLMSREEPPWTELLGHHWIVMDWKIPKPWAKISISFCKLFLLGTSWCKSN